MSCLNDNDNFKTKYICCRGPQGQIGPQGPEGPPGKDGECNCKCKSKGELIKNGGFEVISNNKPLDWVLTNPIGVTTETGTGKVHTGNRSVSVKNDSKISQTIIDVSDDCYYELSFF